MKFTRTIHNPNQKSFIKNYENKKLKITNQKSGTTNHVKNENQILQ
jgi:hypothetical protein